MRGIRRRWSMIALGIKLYDELSQKNQLQRFLVLIGAPIGSMFIYFTISLICARLTDNWLLLSGFVSTSGALFDHDWLVYSDKTNLVLELFCITLIWLGLMIIGYLRSPRIEGRKAVCLVQKDSGCPFSIVVSFRTLVRWSEWLLLTMILVGFFYVGHFFSLEGMEPSILMPSLLLAILFWILFGCLYFIEVGQASEKINWCRWVLENKEMSTGLVQEIEAAGYLKIHAEKVPLDLQKLMALGIVKESTFIQAHLPAQGYVYLTVSKKLLALSRKSNEWEKAGLWIDE